MQNLPSHPIRVHISTCAQRNDRENWGDTAYAEAIAQAIRAHGHEAELFFSGEAPRLSGAGDVVLRIAGPHLDDTVPGVPNLVWMISMPNYVSIRALARFQGVITSSAALSRQYAQAGLPALYMAQATDPDLFHPSRRPEGTETLPLVFVGNYGLRAPRRLIRLVAGLQDFDLALWGDGWKGVIPDRCIRGTRYPYEDLPGLYARSRIVLNSHMGHMAQLGMMSNRSFDALAAGAMVLSDPVQGFMAPDLPELVQIEEDPARLEAWLHRALAAPPADMATRLDRNARIRRGYSFGARADAMLAIFADLLARDIRVPRLFALQPPRAHTTAATAFDLADDVSPDNRTPTEDRIARLDAALAAGPVRLRMRLCDPASMPGVDSLPLAMLRAALAIRRILEVLARRPALAGLEILRDPEGDGQAIIHPLMQDHRRAQALLDGPPPEDLPARVEALALRAQRIIDQLLAADNAETILLPCRLTDPYLVRVMINKPLYRHEGPALDLDRQKTHVALWHRRAALAPERPIGVFLHLYYAELAGIFAERLARIDAPLRLYVSTDSDQKAATIAEALPQARIEIMPNRGRDIAPKFCGFGKAHEDHDIVLHLHGKRSTHARKLDGWMEHVLDCLLPETAQINRILSFFKDIDRIGLIAPQGYRPTLRVAHWAHDRELAEELRHRLKMKAPLPDDRALNFPAGSMFWARSRALQPLLDLGLGVSNFPPEARQMDGTLAHAVERMIGIACLDAGFDLLRVAPSGNNDFPKQKFAPSSNAELRAWLDSAAQTRRNEA